MLIFTLICLRRDRRAGYSLIAAIIAVFLMQAAFTAFAPRSRPAQAMPIGDELLNFIRGSGGTSSFFSGHTASVVIVCTIFYLMQLNPATAFVGGLPIVISRLMPVQHYLSDIMGGIIFGYLTAKIAYKAIAGKRSRLEGSAS